MLGVESEHRPTQSILLSQPPPRPQPTTVRYLEMRPMCAAGAFVLEVAPVRTERRAAHGKNNGF